MSATPPSGLDDVFRDKSDEPSDPIHPLGKRQLATKPTVLNVAEKAKGKNVNSELAKRLVEAAEGLTDAARKAIVIFVNRVATAREAHRLLARKHLERAVLLTGRMRPIDKDDVVIDQLKPLASGQSDERKLDQPIFVVATQTLEVGADLDFDALVTECASLDALRQRFGRLNRMGRPIDARAAVLIRADQAENSEDDPVYGAALAKTWLWLNDGVDENCEIDFGISSLAIRLPNGDALAQLNASSVNAPIMLPAHVDCWSQTAPEPMPTPDVAPFLRGPARGAADVQVCWRADTDLRTPNAEEASKDTLTLCPPAAAECLPVPIVVFKRWMKRQEGDDDTADVESSADEENEMRVEGGVETRRVLRWRGRKDVEVTDDPGAIRPGDIIVLPTYVGGWEILGDVPRRPDATPTLDWGDRAHRQSRAKAQLRLHPSVVDEWAECDTKARFLELTNEAQARYEEDPDALADDLRDAFISLKNDERAAPWLREIASALGKERRLRRCIKLHPLAGLIVQGSRHLPALSEDTDLFSDEDDAAASGTVRVPLFEHLPGVAAYAKRFATGCGLPNPLIDAIERAGLLHDLGKADPRFQALLRNGNPWLGDVLLAKSSDVPQGRSAFLRAREAAHYPEGGRHELLSVRLVENVTGLLPDDEILRDSILHLVASHHGYCRPLAPVVFDEEPLNVTLEFNGQTLIHSSDTGMERLDSGVADRFWRLVRHYGWWGLAWLEGILRLADHRRSEAEAAQKEDESDASA
jgi:CRISPR-associated endonuclease/helicase Cas3